MTDWVKKALTRRKVKHGIRENVEEKANEKLVYAVKFSIAMTLCLTGLEIASMIFMGKWNAEVFAAITGLIGTVSGVLIGQKA